MHRAEALAEGNSIVIAVDSKQVDSANEGKLIHLTGDAASQKGLEDSEFGLEAPGALRLSRNVEMHQWKQNEKTETHSKLGGGEERVTTYTYEKVWSGTRIDSTNFKQAGYANPAEIPLHGKKWNAEDATLGAFKLSEVVLDQLSADKSLTPPASALDAIKKLEFASHKKPVIVQDWVYFGDPAAPAIGDVRIGYSQLPSETLSLVAMQVHGSVHGIPAETGDSIAYWCRWEPSVLKRCSNKQRKRTQISHGLVRGAGILVCVCIRFGWYSRRW